jgi:hypothetical protein
MPREFEFVLTYFLKDGTRQGVGHFTCRCRVIGKEITPDGDVYLPNIHDAIAHLRGKRDAGGPGALPGLGPETEGWDGYMVVTHKNAAIPGLLIPGG